MRIGSRLMAGTLLAAWAGPAILAQITANPVPEPVRKRGLSVEVQDVVRLPDTRGTIPAGQDVSPAGWARINFVRDLPDGRRFVNDSRGQLYLLGTDGQPRLYANVAEAFPRAVYNRLLSGFSGFAFHPEFATNGLFYTVHAEHGPGNPRTPDFIPPGFAPKDVTYHNIITEWRAARPAAGVFDGTRRELLREAHVVHNLTHPMGTAEFNPTARPGDEDYGLLYTSGSDHGFSNGGGPNANTASQTQRLDSIHTAILRFDPRSPKDSGGVKGLGDYTIPMANRFASDGDPATLGEIYAYGFRNAHRLSWDTDGTLFSTDIGMNHIEEINIVRNGGNYGWMRREGYWENGRWRGGVLNELFALPPGVLSGRETDGLVYPVALYDHDEGRAITGGFPYHGRIAALRGKFVFGDIQNGRLFAADLAELKKADDGVPQTVAPIEEIQLYVRDARGNRAGVSMRELVDQVMGVGLPRVDLHLSQTRDGELLLTSRQDGMIRMLVPDPAHGAGAAPEEYCLRGEFDLGLRLQGLRPVSGEFHATDWCVVTEPDGGRVRFTLEGRSNPDVEGRFTVSYVAPDQVRIVNADAPPDIAFVGADVADEARSLARIDPQRLLAELEAHPDWVVGDHGDGRREVRWPGAEARATVRTAAGRLVSVAMTADLPLRGRVPVVWNWTWPASKPEGRVEVLVGGDVMFRATGHRRRLSSKESATLWDASGGQPPREVPGDAWPAVVRMTVEAVSPGVHLVRGVRTGFHHLVVETRAGLVVADAPAGWVELHRLPPADLVPGLGISGLSERFVDVLQERWPGVAIRAVALTHAHDDHAGGARAFAAAGAGIYAPAESAAFVEAALNSDRMPSDRFTATARRVVVRPVGDRLVLPDPERPVALVPLGATPHVTGALGVHVPSARVFFQSDLHVPAGDAATPRADRAPSECWFARWATANLPAETVVHNSHGTVALPVGHLSRYLDDALCQPLRR